MTDYIWLAMTWVICLSCPVLSYTQLPFECDGKLYRVVEERRGSVLQELNLDKQKLTMDIQELGFFPESRINAICYRPSDNLIYGLLLESPYVLCRIDGDYNLTRLRELPLPTNLTFVAGDISPDGRYLVLLGFSINEPGNLLARVDLNDPEFPTEMIPIYTNDNSESIACVDIAFHPTTHILYGFNHKHHRLITIDIEKQLIDNTTFPISSTVLGNVPSIFFDNYGDLYGVGSTTRRVTSRTLLQFDTATGVIKIGQNLGLEANQDGCSCPYTVDLLNIISPATLFPCTKTEIQLVIINRSPFEQYEIQLFDTLPEWMSITKVLKNPFEGKITSGVGSNVLSVQDLVIPIGVDTIIVEVKVSEKAPVGQFQNQAFLKNVFLREVEYSATILSDDPITPVFNDPTGYEVRNLQVDFGKETAFLCKGDSMVLDPALPGMESYHWNTGEKSPFITVKNTGRYQLTVNSGCQESTNSIWVKEEQLYLELGKDKDLEIGESFHSDPIIHSESPIKYFFWSEPKGRNDLSCTTCTSATITPHSSTWLSLEVSNEKGCTTTDTLQITVHPFAMYSPTAFSPNNDGHNDSFYLQGRSDYVIRTLQIFDRWGNMVFQRQNAFANYELLGWDGTCKGKELNAGLYIWQAEIDLAAGKTEKLSGEVMLVR